VQRRWGLMSNYFDHLFYSLHVLTVFYLLICLLTYLLTYLLTLGVMSPGTVLGFAGRDVHGSKIRTCPFGCHTYRGLGHASGKLLKI